MFESTAAAAICTVSLRGGSSVDESALALAVSRSTRNPDRFIVCTGSPRISSYGETQIRDGAKKLRRIEHFLGEDYWLRFSGRIFALRLRAYMTLQLSSSDQIYRLQIWRCARFNGIMQLRVCRVGLLLPLSRKERIEVLPAPKYFFPFSSKFTLSQPRPAIRCAGRDVSDVSLLLSM